MPLERQPATTAGLQELEGEVRLELAFETRELRDICENEAEAKRQFGDAVAEVLKHRLADLDAAISPVDLIAGDPRLEPGNDAMALDLSEGYRLVFAPNHPHNPTTASGGIDWGNVSRIRILQIGRQHA